MEKFPFVPENSSYTVNYDSGVISTKLRGGSARYRRDVLGTNAIINANWIFNPQEFKYAKAFYDYIALKGAVPFLIDLIVDDDVLTEHTAHFIPNSFKLTSQKGLAFFVSATLDVKQNNSNEEYIVVVIEFGSEQEFLQYEDLLDVIVNVDLPESMSL